ncbi:MAG TPA: hypothetical protein VG755_03040, partial [Nannocystaceae bacterium]|nr:hypothetical protein [Nannocystaceae bacterium]
MSADDDELRSFVRRAMSAAVPPPELESRALAGVVARARGHASARDPSGREAAAFVAAAAQDLSPAALAAGAATPSLLKIVVAVVIAGGAGTVAWRSSQDPRTSPPTPVAVAPREPAIVATPTPAEPPRPTQVPIAAPTPDEREV